MTTRRTFIASGLALGTTTILPAGLVAQEDGTHRFETADGPVIVHPIHHASFVIEAPRTVIYVDPVGDPALYEDLPEPDLILITHEHGDHFEPETLQAISAGKTQILTNHATYDLMSPELQAVSQRIANGETMNLLGIDFEAIPAHNTSEDRLDFHPPGRDNGYVFGIGGRRFYVAGDTEGTEEMRALEEIFVAFVPMNLPYTMAAEAAAEAVAAFAPSYVFPYHYRGADGGTQDPERFAELLAETDAETEVRMGAWYAPDEL